MRIKYTHTGEVTTVNDGYGVRLIEQGKAVPAGLDKKPAVKKGKDTAAGDAIGDSSNASQWKNQSQSDKST